MKNQTINTVFKELTLLIKEIFKKTWFILLISLFIFVLILHLLESISCNIFPGSTDAWITFCATIFGSFISVVFTIFVMLYTFRNEENKRLTENLPRIVPSNTTYSDFRFIEDGLPTNDLNYFKNNLYINIYNLGKTGIFDIKGSVQVLNDGNNQFLELEVDDNYIKINNKYSDPSMYINDNYFRFNNKLDLPKQKQNILPSGQTIKIELPHEVTLFLYIVHRAIQENSTERIVFTPKIKVNLEYKNYKNISDEIEFIVDFNSISIHSTPQHDNSYSYCLNGVATIDNQ